MHNQALDMFQDAISMNSFSDKLFDTVASQNESRNFGLQMTEFQTEMQNILSAQLKSKVADYYYY